jgi:hypothetical protein
MVVEFGRFHQDAINWVTWPQKVHVLAGNAATLKLDSGIRPVGLGAGCSNCFLLGNSSNLTEINVPVLQK